MPVLPDPETLRALEHEAARRGIDLMERAGRATAHWLARHVQANLHVLFVCGPGNNGGDALLAARELHASHRVSVWLPEAPRTDAARKALAAARAAGVTLLPPEGPDTPPDYIVDGLFGIGLRQAPGAPWDGIIHRINHLQRPVLALDTPSGLDAFTGHAPGAAIRARHTLTFLADKPGLHTGDGPDLAGQITVARLETGALALGPGHGELNAPSVTGLARPRNSHKGRHGLVHVIGGAPGMTGAALLCARAALACGAGKVRLQPLDSRLFLDPLAPELMIDPETGPSGEDILAIGPGLGTRPAALQHLERALDTTHTLVLDADALNLLGRHDTLLEKLAARDRPVVLTPHPAEAARLLGTDTATVQADRIAAARLLAQRSNAVILLKGCGTLLACPDGYYRINTTGGPALSAAGQGDVLTGMVAAFLAQHLAPLEAASLAAFLHGEAGDHYEKDCGGPIGLTASDTLVRVRTRLNQLLSRQQADRAAPDAGASA